MLFVCSQTQDPECLFSFHSGAIEGLAVSPLTYLMATTALDCKHELLPIPLCVCVLYMHACSCMCIYVLVYVFLCMHVYVHVFWCMSACVVHACMFKYMYMCSGVCVYVVVKELPQVSSSIAFYPMFWDGLSLNLEFTKWLDYPVKKLPGFSCLCFPSSGVTGMFHLAWLFHRYWGSQIKSSCLCSRHFTIWAISLVL